MGDNLLEAPRVVRSGDGRDLDGDVVDVLSRDEARDLGQAVGRFLLTEDGLAQKVDVEAVPALAQASQRRTQAPIRRVDDEVANDFTEHSARGGRDRAGREARSGRAQAHRGGECRGQEALAARRQALHRRAGHIQVRGANDVIDETGGEGQAVRIGEDSRQQLGRLRRRFVGGFVDPAAGPDNCPLPQGPQVIGAASGGGIVARRGGNSGVRHA